MILLSLWLSMLDFPLILWVKLSVVDKIHPQSNRFAMGVGNKATGDSKLNDSPEHKQQMAGLEIGCAGYYTT